MSSMCDEAHLRRHIAVGHLALHRAEGCVRRLVPLRHTALRLVDVAAEATFGGLDFAGEAVHVVCEEVLGKGGIDAALVLRNERVASTMAGVHRGGEIVWIEACGLVLD